MLGPTDEFPIHQIPQPISWPGSSDRNFYDRSYFNAHDRTGDIFLITGIGYYPNLGVKDAFVLVRRGDTQTAVHLCDAHRLRPAQPACLRLPGRGHRTAAQAADRPRRNRGHRRRSHLERAVRRDPGAASRPARRDTSDAGRTAVRPGRQLERARSRSTVRTSPSTPTSGSAAATGHGASGRLVNPNRPAGRPHPPFEGMWWLYVPMAFDDFAIVPDHPGGAQRVPLPQRLHPDLARRARRAAGLAPGERSTTAPAPGSRPARPSRPPQQTARPSASTWSPSCRCRSTSAAATAATRTGCTGCGRATSSPSV